LFLPLASLTLHLRPPLGITLGLLLLTLLAGFTWQRAQLWRNTEHLQTYWATSSPNSPRAQSFLGNALTLRGRYDEAETLMQAAMARRPDSAFLTLSLLLQRRYAQRASAADYQWAASRLQQQTFDAQSVTTLGTLVEQIRKPPIQPEEIAAAHALVYALGAQGRKHPSLARLLPALQGKLFLLENQPEEALKAFLRAMDLYGETDACLAMTTEIWSAGYPQQALTALARAKEIYRQQDVKQRSPDVYNMKFTRLENAMRQDVRDQNEKVKE
ncbi:MAG: hypothetical protein LBQ81_05040, partial [Zoogloeaceae bacterium]|nr:hypothetical protein [Zoogloeaceae bacterium]